MAVMNCHLVSEALGDFVRDRVVVAQTAEICLLYLARS